MLKMRNITVRNVLIDFNLDVAEGEFIIITGENGAGKTTLLNTISGNVLPKNGQIFIDGEDVTRKPQYARTKLIASVAQDPKVGTVANMSIRDNMNSAYMRGKTRSFKSSCSMDRDVFFKERLKELEMGLENRLDDLVGDLSGGQRQALSVIMAFLADFKILLLDEITAALNSTNSEKIMNLVNQKCRAMRKTCLMITHNQDQIKKFGDRVLVVERK